MNFRLLRDLVVYIMLPFIIFKIPNQDNTQIIFPVMCAVLLIYSLYTKSNESRINFTFLVISLIISSYFSIGLNLNRDNGYIYKTCILLLLGLLISVLRVFNKDLIIRVIKDTLRMFNKNTTVIVKLLKKKHMVEEIKKVGSMMESTCILIGILRIINILIDDKVSVSYFNFTTNFVGILLSVYIVYKLVKLFKEIQKLNMSSSKIEKVNSSSDNKKGKVINFNTFR